MISVGLIGYGLAGRVFHAPYVKATAGLTLKAIATRQAADALADHPDAQVRTPSDLIASADIDLVVIATPNITHLDLGLQALAAGKSVVIDKPMALNTRDAQALFTSADRRKLILCPFHNRRFDDDFLTVKALLAEDALGAVATYESRFDRFRPQIAERWREAPGPGSGVWWDLGPHLVDQTVHLFGRPDAVTGDLARQRRGAKVDDYAHVVLHYGSRRAILRASCLVSGSAQRFCIEGVSGSFVTDGFDPQEQRIRDPGATSGVRSGLLTTGSGPELLRRYVPLIEGDYGRFYQAMRDAMIEGSAPPVSRQDALGVTEILELAVASSERGRTLPLSDVAP